MFSEIENLAFHYRTAFGSNASAVVIDPTALPSSEFRRLDESEALAKVINVNCNIEENGIFHQTKYYSVMREKEKPTLVVRRGQPFRLTFKISSQLTYDDQIKLSFYAEDSFTQVENVNTCVNIITPFGYILNHSVDCWDAICDFISRDGKSLYVQVLPSSEAPVGKWYVEASIVHSDEGEVQQSIPKRVEHPFVILFNASDNHDTAFMPGKGKRHEYLMREYGLIYRGSKAAVTRLLWKYCQYDEEILNFCLNIINQPKLIPRNQCGDIVAVSQAIAEVVSEVMHKNDTGHYYLGKDPLDWTSSVKIIREFVKDKEPVKFGTPYILSAILASCNSSDKVRFDEDGATFKESDLSFRIDDIVSSGLEEHVVTVVSGVLACCTLRANYDEIFGSLRALGIATRLVTGYNWANKIHNYAGTVDTFYTNTNYKGVALKNENTVWSYFVWCEIWLKGTFDNLEANGWAALCSTHGPFPIKLLHSEDISSPHKNFFNRGTNAPLLIWKYFSHGAPIKLITVDINFIGSLIITKAVGSWNFEDITATYKSTVEEVSWKERMYMLHAALPKDPFYGGFYMNPDFDVVHVKSETKDVYTLDEPIKFTFFFQNKNKEKAYKVSTRLTVSSILCNGKVLEKIKDEQNNTIIPIHGLQKVEFIVSPTEYVARMSEECLFKISAQAHFAEETFDFYDFRIAKAKVPEIRFLADANCIPNKRVMIELSAQNTSPVPICDFTMNLEELDSDKYRSAKRERIDPYNSKFVQFPVIPQKIGMYHLTGKLTTNYWKTTNFTRLRVIPDIISTDQSTKPKKVLRTIV